MRERERGWPTTELASTGATATSGEIQTVRERSEKLKTRVKIMKKMTTIFLCFPFFFIFCYFIIIIIINTWHVAASQQHDQTNPGHVIFFF
jgi:hypothetical protein